MLVRTRASYIIMVLSFWFKLFCKSGCADGRGYMFSEVQHKIYMYTYCKPGRNIQWRS